MKSNNMKLKMALMVFFALLSQFITKNGFPSDKSAWIIAIAGITGTCIVYLGKTLIFPSVSVMGTIDLRDLLSGILIAIGNGLGEWAGTAIAGAPLNWNQFLENMGMVALMYILSKFAFNGLPADFPTDALPPNTLRKK